MIREIVLFMQHGLSMVGDNAYLQALIAVVIGLVAARMIHLVLALAQRLASKTSTRLDDMLLQSLDRPLKTTVVTMGLGVATLLLEMPESAEFATIAALRTVVVIVWIRFVMRLVRYVCRLIANRPGQSQMIQPATLPLFDNLTLLASIALGAYLILHVWSIDITAWVASAGIIGLALSFAAKDSLANLFAGVFIIADAPYRVGDYVVLDTGERGRVTHIGVRSTRLLTRDDVEVTIPNSVMGNTKIVNETGGPHPKYRVRIPVGVCYGEDLDKVRKALIDVTADNPKICRDPSARVRYRAFGDWSINLELLCWVDAPVLRGMVTDELIVAIYKTFNERDITFPYPRQEHYVRSLVAPGTVED